MSSFLTETLGVAESGVMWDVAQFKLWQSTRPDIILFNTKQPSLAKGSNGRYQAAVSVYNQQLPDGSYKITGGAAIFTITSAVQFDPAGRKAAEDSWRAAMGNAVPKNVQFQALNVQKGEATVLIDEMSGKPDKAHNDKDVGTPGGTMSFLVNLTETGALAWAQALKKKTPIPAGVKFQYEYLRRMPQVSATVIVHAKRVFQHLSMALDVSVNGFWYGGSVKIDAAWEKLTREGAIEIVFDGGGLPPDLEKMRQDLTSTFASQAREIFFNQIFAPKPDVKPAQAGSTSGVFGGANFAMKWRKESDAIDMSQKITFKGFDWLKASMDADLTTLFSVLDQSYLTEVPAQQSFPSSIVIDSDEMLSDVAYSINYSAGRAPVSAVVGQTGGTGQYAVVSTKPNDVVIKYNAKINYAAPKWPIIEVSDSKKVGQGGNMIVIKPGQWVGRHEIYMFVRDGDRILPPSEMSPDDYLVLNVSYSGPHLAAPVKDSAHLSGLEMVQFMYPMDTKGRPGVAKFSAFGVIGGKLVRSTEQVINPDETAVFILASKDGKIQLVSQNSVLPEADPLAQDLLQAGARPLLTGGVTPPEAETESPEPVTETSEYVTTAPTNGNGNVVEGVTVGLEYSAGGPALWVDQDNGGPIRILLRHREEANFGRKQHVKVRLDESKQYAESILVDLVDA